MHTFFHLLANIFYLLYLDSKIPLQFHNQTKTSDSSQRFKTQPFTTRAMKSVSCYFSGDKWRTMHTDWMLNWTGKFGIFWRQPNNFILHCLLNQFTLIMMVMVLTVADEFLSIRSSSYNYFTAKPMQRELQQKLRKPR